MEEELAEIHRKIILLRVKLMQLVEELNQIEDKIMKMRGIKNGKSS